MGGLAHYLEEDGLPTTQISLIREHTETIKPPRALWVPFELGRPLGVPGDAAWQTRVLLATLELLEAPHGPVLVDFPDDVPIAADAPTAVACPVNFAAPGQHLSDVEQLRLALHQEIVLLRSWYDLAVKERGRTTVGVSGLDPETLGVFIGAFLDGSIPESPQAEFSAAELFKLALEDVKAYYNEAVAAQPGRNAADSATLADWFWRETTAGQVLYAIQEICRESDDSRLQLIGNSLLVPRSHRADSPYNSA